MTQFLKLERYLGISTCTEIMRWIITDPEVCQGKPILKGTRIFVSDVRELVAAGESFEEIVKEYPSLNKDMIKEALEFNQNLD
jgi:uncharacterized protein (DUF433 family)